MRGSGSDNETALAGPGPIRLGLAIAGKMTGFLAVMVLANLVVTGFALLPISPTVGHHPTLDGRFGMGIGPYLRRAIETPIPQDWVGFLTQIRHQRSGGPSYLFGERRMTGWWSYYFVTLAVKTPLALWLLVAGRVALGRRVVSSGRAGMLPLIVVIFLAITAAGSSRNYGIRYLLPLAPLAVVWVSGLAEAGTWGRRAAAIGLVGQALAVATIHPFELSYFNALAGGPAGGRHILADSNLDWGQGAKPLARLQRAASRVPRPDALLLRRHRPRPLRGRRPSLRDRRRGRAPRPPADALGRDGISGRLRLAPVGSLGTGGLFSEARRDPARPLDGRRHDRHLSHERRLPSRFVPVGRR